MLAVWVFFVPLACGTLHAVLTYLSWVQGDQLTIGGLDYAENGFFRATDVEYVFGLPAHRSSWRCARMEIKPIQPWHLLQASKNRRLIQEMKILSGKLLVDRREITEENGAKNSIKGRTFLKPEIFFPSAIEGGPMDMVIIGDSYRVSLSGIGVNLPDLWAGRVSYQEAQLDLGSLHETFAQGAAAANWDGTTLHLEKLNFGKDLKLQELTLALHGDRMDFGIRGGVGKALLRGDGSMGSPGTMQVTMVGENLQLGALAELMGQNHRASGTIGQARLTFRGDPAHPMDADCSLRLAANDFRWDGRGWDSLRLASTLTGRKLTVSELSLQQGENILLGKGLVNLPANWRDALKSPFTASFSASLDDAGALASLAGSQFAIFSGGLDMEGEIRGDQNKATGYCNLQGVGMRVHGLPVDWLKGDLLFEGDHIVLNQLEAWSGQDKIALEGSVQNSAPHAYKASAQIDVRNLTKRLAQLGIRTAAIIGGGAVKCSWQGEGTSETHTGSFQASVTEWISKWTATGMSGTFEGAYAPGHLQLRKAEFLLDDLKLLLKLNATQKMFEATGIKAIRGQKATPLVEGSIQLPLDATDVWENGEVMKTLEISAPFGINLSLHGIKAEEIEEVLGQRIRMIGVLEGNITALGTLENPEIHAGVSIGRFVSQAGEQPMDLELKVDAAKRGIKGSLKQTAEKITPLEIEFEGPLHMTKDLGQLKLAKAPGLIHVKAKAEHVSLDGWASLMGLGWWPFKGSALTGSFNLDGTLDHPTLLGDLLLESESAALIGSQRLDQIRVPLSLDSTKAVITSGFADYNGRPVKLSGDLNWSHEQSEGHLELAGESLPIQLGKELHGIGNADLRVDIKPAGGPVLSGTIAMKSMSGKIPLRLTPSFCPPGISVPMEKIPGMENSSSVLGTMQVQIGLNTHGVIPLERPQALPAKGEHETPGIALDLTLSGDAVAPNLDGMVLLRNGQVELPCGPFYFPEARLVVAGGKSRFKTTAYGMTRMGLISLEIAATPETIQVESLGAVEGSGPDQLLALATPGTAKNPDQEAGEFLNQTPAWIRQNMLLAERQDGKISGSSESIESASLGFHGSPWGWRLAWSAAKQNNQ